MKLELPSTRWLLSGEAVTNTLCPAPPAQRCRPLPQLHPHSQAGGLIPTADMLERFERRWKIILRCSQKVGKLAVKARPFAVCTGAAAHRHGMQLGQESGEAQCKRCAFLKNGRVVPALWVARDAPKSVWQARGAEGFPRALYMYLSSRSFPNCAWTSLM